jgi:2-keto-4-pentenoate hydratase/2-oxohepta-3-ene-1,7-dioic acid hydratase in catechol pathway
VRLYNTTSGVARADDDGLALLGTAHPDVAALLGDHDIDPSTAPVRGRVALDDVELISPVTHGGRVFLVGANYRDHIEEAGLAMPKRVGGLPLPSGILSGPVDDIRLPAEAPNEVDYEGEIAILIGQPGHEIAPGDGWNHIAGLCAANDVSARDVQHSGMADGRVTDIARVRLGKSFPSFKPIGPCILTIDEARSYPRLSLSTRVNGEVRQSATTDDMVFDLSAIVEGMSMATDLRPGDLILTGTPAGIGLTTGRFLQAGDVVEVTVSGIGTLRNQVVAPVEPH